MGYRIETSTDGNDPWMMLVESNAGTSYADTGMAPETTKHYRVFAINSVGMSQPSNVDSATTTAAPVEPGAPTGLTAMAMGRTQIGLSWTAPVNDGGATVTGYMIESSADGMAGSWMVEVADTGSTETTYPDISLDPETTKHYRVSAINSAGTGMASNVTMATTEALMVPGAPTGLTATADGPMEIDLSWSAPTETGGADITGYRIESSADGSDGSWMDLVANTGSAATTYTDDGSVVELAVGDTRHYRVSAISSVGTGPVSNVDSATTTAAAEPMTLMERYDDNDNNKIDREEVLNGIDDFFTPPVGSVISREQVLDLIDLFFEGLGKLTPKSGDCT